MIVDKNEGTINVTIVTVQGLSTKLGGKIQVGDKEINLNNNVRGENTPREV